MIKKIVPSSYGTAGIFSLMFIFVGVPTLITLVYAFGRMKTFIFYAC
jgi:hypothetical protein